MLIRPLDELLSRIKERLRFAPAIESHRHCQFSNENGILLPPFLPHPVISLADVEFVEACLGFALPTSVRRLSLEVADGGYGPGWGIIRLKQPPDLAYGYPQECKMSVESWHWLDHNPDDYESLESMQESLAVYPEKYIRYCEVGCNIWICVDCTSDEGPVFLADPNTLRGERDRITPLHQSVDAWLWSWLEDEPWPELEFASLDIHPETHQGRVLGYFSSVDDPI